jgi:hypothetical protein
MSVAHHRRAGGQRHTAGIDEPATVDLDARRVGDDHFGSLAGHLDVPAEVGGLAAVDLVEDHARAARGQPGIALHPAAELGGGVGAAVVEDGALGVHVELAVGVARDAGGAGRGDVDQGDAVGGRQYGGALRAGCGGIGRDLGHRRAHPAQGQRQAGQAPARRTPPGGRGRCLASCMRAAAMGRGDFAHRHEQATRGVEDDAMGVAVHCRSPAAFTPRWSGSRSCGIAHPFRTVRARCQTDWRGRIDAKRFR